MMRKRLVCQGIVGICILLIMPNALANVVYQSSDTSFNGWNQNDPQHPQSSNTIITIDPILDHQTINAYSLEIKSPQGGQNLAYIDSTAMWPFNPIGEYRVNMEIFVPTSTLYKIFYVYSSGRITLYINTESDNLPHLWSYGHHGGVECWFNLGILSQINPNFIQIHANLANCDYQVSLNNGGFNINLYYDNTGVDGNVIHMGDSVNGGGNLNYGDCYYDSIRIWHTTPDPTINNYDLSEDFAFGLDYWAGDWNAQEFWVAHKAGAGFVQTNKNYNKDDWDITSDQININAQPFTTAWAKTPVFNYGFTGPYNEYTISFWFYLDSPQCNFFHLLWNGNVNLVLTKGATGVNLYYISSLVNPHQNLINTLNLNHWYRIFIDVYPNALSYQIYIDNLLQQNIPGATNLLNHGTLACIFTDSPNYNNYLNMGSDDGAQNNYGEGWYDDMRVDNHNLAGT